VLAVIGLLNLAGAQELPSVFGLPQAVVLRRIPADERWDLVVALSSAQPCEPAPRPCWWNTRDRLLVLLRDRDNPAKTAPLVIEPGPNNDCSTRVERFTVQELVLSCVGEKWTTYDNQKFVYDGKVYPLPQTDNQSWQKARPDDTKGYLHPDQAEMNEQIGPNQMEGGLFWFGKTFYNSEGFTGVGGFGYFDPATASYHLFAPPEMSAWSVSAIRVERDCVWLALYRRGEYGNYPGGLLRWDRNTKTVRRWDMPWIATGMVRAGEAVYMGTTDGIAVLRGDALVSYFVDRSAAGQYRMAERN
jgi:hypothetical protein